MVELVSTLIIIASLLLILVVFVQNPKGGGLSSDFGSAQQLGGVQRTSDFIEKATWGLAAAIMVCSIFLTTLMKPEAPKVDPNAGQQGTEQPGPGGQPAQGGQQPQNGQPAR